MTSTIRSMMETHPDRASIADLPALTACLEACLACAQSCTACADACLAEDMVAELRPCIRHNLTCADLCGTTARVLSRPDGDPAVQRALLEACRAACAACAEECESHADMHEHCRHCAEACRTCEQACAALLTALG